MLNRARLLTFDERGDSKGKLIAIEELKDLGFQIARVFYIYDTVGSVVRGNHANRNSDFILINVHGSSKVKVDDGRDSNIFILDNPCTGLYIPKMLWKEMYDFSPDSVMLVLSNQKYDPDEYISNYSEYIYLVEESRNGKIKEIKSVREGCL